MKHWKANKSRLFGFLLQHFPKYLSQYLNSNGRFEAMNDSKDVISLIPMIYDVYHQHDNTTHGTMALVTNDLALYTMFTTIEDHREEFNGTFNAMADKINFHGRSAEYHPQLYADHIAILCVERMLDPTTIFKGELEKVQKDAKKSACEKFFSVPIRFSCRLWSFPGAK